MSYVIFFLFTYVNSTGIDAEQSGYVDADLLVDGLARLGIGVVYTVAEQVLSGSVFNPGLS